MLCYMKNKKVNITRRKRRRIFRYKKNKKRIKNEFKRKKSNRCLKFV